MSDKSNNAKTANWHESDKTNYEQGRKHNIWGTCFYLIVFGTVQLLQSTSCTQDIYTETEI